MRLNEINPLTPPSESGKNSDPNYIAVQYIMGENFPLTEANQTCLVVQLNLYLLDVIFSNIYTELLDTGVNEDFIYTMLATLLFYYDPSHSDFGRRGRSAGVNSGTDVLEYRNPVNLFFREPHIIDTDIKRTNSEAIVFDRTTIAFNREKLKEEFNELKAAKIRAPSSPPRSRTAPRSRTRAAPRSHTHTSTVRNSPANANSNMSNANNNTHSASSARGFYGVRRPRPTHSVSTVHRATSRSPAPASASAVKPRNRTPNGTAANGTAANGTAANGTPKSNMTPKKGGTRNRRKKHSHKYKKLKSNLKIKHTRHAKVRRSKTRSAPRRLR